MPKVLVIFQMFPYNVSGTFHEPARIGFAYRRWFSLDLPNPYDFGKKWDTVLIYGISFRVRYVSISGPEIYIRPVDSDMRTVLRRARENGHRLTRRTYVFDPRNLP